MLVMEVLGVWATLAWLLDHDGNRDLPDGSFDAVVVLGCGVRSDGSASPALARRTQYAIELFHDGRAPRLVFTGGVGNHGASEAHVAAELARAQGIPETALVLEERSHSTRENAQFAAALLGKEQRVLLVSDRYHVFRAERVFRQFFENVEAVGSTGTWSGRVRGSLREVLAVAAYGLFGPFVLLML